MEWLCGSVTRFKIGARAAAPAWNSDPPGIRPWGKWSRGRAAAHRRGREPAPPTASAFACGSASATPPQGGSDRVLLEALCWPQALPPGGGVGETRAPPAVEPVGGGNWRDRQIGESARSRAGGGQTLSSVIYRDYSHRCTGYTGSGLRILVSCFPGHPQTRGGSSAESASRAVTSRSVNPVHPVYPCS